MKLSVFLLILVAASHQQYLGRNMFRLPWISTRFAQQQPIEYPHYYNPRYHDDSYSGPDATPVIIVNRVNEEHPRASTDRMMNTGDRSQQFDDMRVEPRVKNYGHRQQDLTFGNKPQNRFFFTKQYQTYKTATLTITSTCTAITFRTCVPRANFRPPLPRPVPNCRRKRQAESDLLEDDLDNQFAIDPSQVQLVMPTEQPMKVSFIHDGREITREIMSSKEEEGRGRRLVDASEMQMRNKKRFLYLVPSVLVAETTITSWSVLSTIVTSTFVPAEDFLCLPPGFTICP
nr:putative cladoceran-specific protein type 2 [Daphnia magna]